LDSTVDLDTTVSDEKDISCASQESGALGIPARAFKMLKLSPSFSSWGSFSGDNDDILEKIGSFW